MDHVALKKDVQELLNQVAIKLENIKKFKTSYDDLGRGNNPFWEQYDPEKDDYVMPNLNADDKAEIYLSCVKNSVQRMLKDKTGEDLVKVENKYYSSACW